jgi:hypothetical protein
MRKGLFIIFAILNFAWIYFILWMIFKSDKTDDLNQKVTIALEEAYFDGQRDAINGHVVIKFDSSKGIYVWTDSPWNSRKPAKFIPTQKDNQISKYNN